MGGLSTIIGGIVLAASTLSGGALAQGTSTQHSPMALCHVALHSQALLHGLPSLSLATVRRRACECMMVSASLPAVSEAEGSGVPPAFSAAAGRCLRAAVANEPVPAVPDSAVRVLLAAVAPSAKSKFVPPGFERDSCPKPDYPPAAARTEATGTTRLVFHVSATGELADAEIVNSSGKTIQHKLLDSVALYSLMRCRFSAATLNGEPVEASSPLEYVWRLE